MESRVSRDFYWRDVLAWRCTSLPHQRHHARRTSRCKPSHLVMHIYSRLIHYAKVHGHHVPRRPLPFHGSLQNSRTSRRSRGRDEGRRNDKVGMVTSIRQDEDSGYGASSGSFESQSAHAIPVTPDIQRAKDGSMWCYYFWLRGYAHLSLLAYGQHVTNSSYFFAKNNAC